MRRRGVRGSNGLDAWPGYVDALSTLLMVIIFVLLVFVLSQAFLGVALNGRQTALDKLSSQMARLNELLSLEKSKGHALELSVATLRSQHESDQRSNGALSAQLLAETA
ncbi:MAG: peptidoglycan-binding protein, partial [Gluconacetobacter diazotrophicus]|nr:peptidoglycan-binding protein [Gluconacetobacter diazotrophicus]